MVLEKCAVSADGTVGEEEIFVLRNQIRSVALGFSRRGAVLGDSGSNDVMAAMVLLVRDVLLQLAEATVLVGGAERTVEFATSVLRWDGSKSDWFASLALLAKEGSDTGVMLPYRSIRGGNVKAERLIALDGTLFDAVAVGPSDLPTWCDEQAWFVAVFWWVTQSEGATPVALDQLDVEKVRAGLPEIAKILDALESRRRRPGRPRKSASRRKMRGKQRRPSAPVPQPETGRATSVKGPGRVADEIVSRVRADLIESEGAALGNLEWALFRIVVCHAVALASDPIAFRETTGLLDSEADLRSCLLQWSGIESISNVANSFRGADQPLWVQLNTAVEIVQTYGFQACLPREIQAVRLMTALHIACGLAVRGYTLAADSKTIHLLASRAAFSSRYDLPTGSSEGTSASNTVVAGFVEGFLRSWLTEEGRMQWMGGEAQASPASIDASGTVLSVEEGRKPSTISAV